MDDKTRDLIAAAHKAAEAQQTDEYRSLAEAVERKAAIDKTAADAEAELRMHLSGNKALGNARSDDWQIPRYGYGVDEALFDELSSANPKGALTEQE